MTASLDAATSLPALLAATGRAARGKRALPDVAAFCMDAERRCIALRDALRVGPGAPGAWEPSTPRLRWIRDPKPRRIAVLPFPDRVVHHALCAVLVPELERRAISDSWACRVGRGQHGALRRARRFARRWGWCAKLDVSRFFASVPVDGVVSLLRRRVEDRGVRRWLEAIVRTGAPGLPLGALVSQHLANAWLDSLDHVLKDRLGVRGYLRYMDDMLIFGDRPQVDELRAAAVEHLGRLKLTVNPRVSGMFRCSAGIPLLGWVVSARGLRPDRRTRRRWLRRVRRASAEVGQGSASEAEVARRVAAATAHLAFHGTISFRRAALARSDPRGRGLQRACAADAPRQPRGLLQEHARQRPGGEPQEEHPGQREGQPRRPPRALDPVSGLRAGSPDAADPREGGLRQGDRPDRRPA